MLPSRLEHPGLVFPDSPSHYKNNINGLENLLPGLISNNTSRPKVSRHRTVVKSIPANWGITTPQLSKYMGISTSGVRQIMHRHKVERKFIRAPLGGPQIMFWKKSQALALIESQPKRIRKLPKGYIMGKEAQLLLNVSSTSLNRICIEHKIPSRMVRFFKDLDASSRLRRIYSRKSILNVIHLYKEDDIFISNIN